MRRMTTDKQVVKVVNEAIEDGEITIPSDLPKIESGDAGKILQVNNNEDGVEWVQAPEELPDITGNEGKVLTVGTDAETGDPVAEWADVPEELPEIQSGDAGKVLKVNEQEDGVEWGSAGGGAFKNVSSSNLVAAGINAADNLSAGTDRNSGIILDCSLTEKATNYVPYSNISGEYTMYSLLILDGNRQSTNRYLPIADHSIYFGYTPDTKTNQYQQKVSNSILLNNYSYNDVVDLKNSIVTTTSGLANTMTANYHPILKHSLVLGSPNIKNTSYSVSIYNSILTDGITWSYTGNSYIKSCASALLLGGSDSSSKKNSISVNATSGAYLDGVILSGTGNIINCTQANNNACAIVGLNGTLDTSTDRFAVGAGTSTSARANCFSTGKDASNNMFIKIGDTILTETQLQALLALLNA